MDDLTTLIQRVRSGDVEAFSPVVKQFQDMAVGYAYSILGDFHLAEDAAQNAFMTAYLNLESVRDPAGFPGWMRRIVFTECRRLTRGSRPHTVELEEAVTSKPNEAGPEQALDASERSALVSRLMASLPDRSREVTILYYLSDLSQKEIAAFLEVEEGTVKKRLHDARERMRKGVERMTKENLNKHRPSRDDRFSESVVATITTTTEAIMNGECDRLRALLDAHPTIINVGGALDFRYGDGSYFAGASLLHFLAGHPTPHNRFPDNVLELMTVLLDAGADPNATTAVGSTMLALVGSYTVPGEDGIQIKMMQLLLNRGADPNAGYGVSALEEAARHGETEAAEMLYRNGGKIDLRLAAGLGLIAEAECYFEDDGSLKGGADALLPPLRDGTVHELDSAEVLMETLSLAVLNWQFEMVDFLLSKGANINGHDINCHSGHHTPLHHACGHIAYTRGNASPKMVAFLLDRGADSSIRDAGEPKSTPFGWAIHNELPEIVTSMIERGAEVGNLDAHLRYAVSRGSVGVVKSLLNGGAHPEVKTGPDKKSALEVAKEDEGPELIDLLQKRIKG